MPDLLQLTGGAGSEPSITTLVPQNAQIEPLDGPTSVDAVMDRFPEEIYQQGHDTHLYRFLQALCGDAGAGLIKKQAYVSRLKWEAELMNFQTLDEFYTSHFRFRRLKSETYTQDPSEALTPDQWDAIQLADQSYKHRIMDFFNATRLGITLGGVTLAARAATGIDCAVFPQYKYIFDQYSDDPLGFLPVGQTISTSEYVIIPRVANAAGVGDPSSTYGRSFTRTYTFTPPVLNSTVKPPTITTPLAVTQGYASGTGYQLLPEIERNLVEILDEIGPFAGLATVSIDRIGYTSVAADPSPVASSEFLHVNRFVTGRADVPWPNTDPAKNYFIESGVENEAGHFYAAAREYPVIFHTVEGIRAYTSDAENDPSYGTTAFYISSGLIPFERYRSEHTGSFLSVVRSIFTFLDAAPTDITFGSDKALAVQETPLVLEGGTA